MRVLSEKTENGKVKPENHKFFLFVFSYHLQFFRIVSFDPIPAPNFIH
jgi:hypothetical protein